MEAGDVDEELGLRVARRKAFDLFEAGDTASNHQELQFYLADAILAAEALKARFRTDKAKRSILRDHIRQLRAYGDALAWRVLHSHTIRQLGKNQATPPLLSNQLKAVNLAKECIEGCAKKEITALACDLTNILRIGDLIVAGHPEYPAILELKASKTSDERKYLGRRGRQMSRMEGTAKYLHEGEAQVYGEPYIRRVIELAVHPEYEDKAVAPLLAEAIESGFATKELSPHHFAVAFTAEDGFRVPDELEASIAVDSRFTMGLHSRPLLETWSEFRSPLVWEIAPELRWALMEQEVKLVHLLGYAAIIGFTNEDGTIVSIDEPTAEVEAQGVMGAISVRIGDSQELELASLNSLHRVMYGNESVDSYCRGLIDGAMKSKALMRKLDSEGRL